MPGNRKLSATGRHNNTITINMCGLPSGRQVFHTIKYNYYYDETNFTITLRTGLDFLFLGPKFRTNYY